MIKDLNKGLDKTYLNYKRKNSFSFLKQKKENNNNLMRKSVALMRQISNNYIKSNLQNFFINYNKYYWLKYIKKYDIIL